MTTLILISLFVGPMVLQALQLQSQVRNAFRSRKPARIKARR